MTTKRLNQSESGIDKQRTNRQKGKPPTGSGISKDFTFAFIPKWSSDYVLCNYLSKM